MRPQNAKVIMKLMKKYIKRQRQKQQKKLKNGQSFKKKNLIKTELNTSKVDLKMSKETEIKKCKTFLGK